MKYIYMHDSIWIVILHALLWIEWRKCYLASRSSVLSVFKSIPFCFHFRFCFIGPCTRTNRYQDIWPPRELLILHALRWPTGHFTRHWPIRKVYSNIPLQLDDSVITTTPPWPVRYINMTISLQFRQNNNILLNARLFYYFLNCIR